MVDYFIITETQYFSFTEAGLIKQLRKSSTYKVLHEDELELLKEKMAAEAADKERRIMATKLLKDGFTIAAVVKYTGLKKKVVEGLVKPGK